MAYRDSDGNPYPPTTSSDRIVKEGKVSWNNYPGTKESRDIVATQMNVKDTETGDHTFYSPSSGRSGVAGGNRGK